MLFIHHRTHTPVRHLLFALLAMSSVACEDATVCPSDLRWELAHRDTTVAVNAGFNMRLTLLGCAGTERLSDTVSWASSDPAVATVDARTGAVTAVSAGTAQIAGKTSRYSISVIARVTERN